MKQLILTALAVLFSTLTLCAQSGTAPALDPVQSKPAVRHAHHHHHGHHHHAHHTGA